jgi:basic membrane protein A and related proteins
MKKKFFVRACVALLLIAVLSSACAPAATPAPVQSQPQAEEPAAPVAAVAEESKELNIAVVMSTTIEEPWNAVYIQALDRVAAAKPHGLTIKYDYAENVATADAERVMQGYAATGKYGILVYHSGQYADMADVTRNKYPDVLIAGSGSGFKPLGGNFIHSDTWVHECAYMLGVVAGHMTESNTLGAVGAFPYPNVNLPVNAFFAGAKSVNPDIKQVMTYLESWWDPAKAKESAAAQIAAGADFIYAERFGVFEAAKEGNVRAFGHYSDQHELAPDTVVSSTVARWDPALYNMVDIWWEHATKNTPYDVAEETFTATYAEGVCDIAPFYALDDTVSAEAKAALEKVQADIKSGALQVPMIEEQVESTK